MKRSNDDVASLVTPESARAAMENAPPEVQGRMLSADDLAAAAPLLKVLKDSDVKLVPAVMTGEDGGECTVKLSMTLDNGSRAALHQLRVSASAGAACAEHYIRSLVERRLRDCGTLDIVEKRVTGLVERALTSASGRFQAIIEQCMRETVAKELAKRLAAATISIEIDRGGTP